MTNAIHSIRRLLVAGLLIGPCLVGNAEDTTTSLPSPARPGRFTLTIRSGNVDRVAQVHIPQGYKSDGTLPLVLTLHGAGGNGSGMLDKDGWAAKADKERFIAVAPDGLPIFPTREANFRTNPPVWNSGQLKATSPRGAIDDVAFIRHLLDTLAERVSYNKTRVFCTGHSNGSGMTFRLAAELSERFAAIGSVAGMMAINDPHPERPLPTLYIIGTKDPLMPLAGGAVKLPWGNRENPPVSERLGIWATAIGCEAEPKLLDDKDGVKTVEYPSKSAGPTLKVLYLDGHGHHWPGGQRTVLPENFMGPITSKLNATDVLWDFFATCVAKN